VSQHRLELPFPIRTTTTFRALLRAN